MDLKNINKLFINTPLVEISYKYLGKTHMVYAKCEWYSLTGSIKDKVAFQIISNAIENGTLQDGTPIVEASSGNMGLSLSAIGNLTHNPVTILMPKTMSAERKNLIKLYGATLIETDDFSEAFELCKEYQRKGYFCPNQFDNPNNTFVHENITAKEILQQLPNNHKAKAFVAGIGTSGTYSGVGKLLKQKLNLKIIALEPINARIVSNIKPYKPHALQGLSDEKLPSLYNHHITDNIIQITDNDAIAMSRKLCQQLSLGVGISSGANFLGAVLSQQNAITVFPDDNKKYLSTKLSEQITTPLVDSIELINLKVL